VLDFLLMFAPALAFEHFRRRSAFGAGDGAGPMSPGAGPWGEERALLNASRLALQMPIGGQGGRDLLPEFFGQLASAVDSDDHRVDRLSLFSN